MLKSKENVCIIRKNNKALNNQMQGLKLGSVDLVLTNAKIGLRKMKIQFPDKLMITHLNINSIRNNI